MVGEVATQMAHTPLKSEVAAQMEGGKSDKGKGKRMSLAALFRLVTFKLPPKASENKNDDGTTSKALGQALIQLGDTEIHFVARISEQQDKDGNETGLSISMPSARRYRFSPEAFTTDDNATAAEYQAWKDDIVTRFVKWEADLKGKGISAAAATGRITRAAILKAK